MIVSLSSVGGGRRFVAFSFGLVATAPFVQGMVGDVVEVLVVVDVDVVDATVLVVVEVVVARVVVVLVVLVLVGAQVPVGSHVPPVHPVPGVANVQMAVQHEEAVPFAAPSSHCSPASTTPLPHTAGDV